MLERFVVFLNIVMMMNLTMMTRVRLIDCEST